MLETAPNINSYWANLIIEELVRNGVTVFYISPGSRSTPLTVAAAENPAAETHICFDERVAAFAAVGYARGAGKPAALICTSGTAAANYYPAVIEAAVDHVPLIVLTADRPPELRGTGANQTIDQNRLYGAYPKKYVDLPCPNPAIAPEYVLSTVDRACSCINGFNKGAVHFNCMFREPLAPKPEPFTTDRAALAGWHTSTQPYSLSVSPALHGNPDADTLDQIHKSGSGIIIAGRLDTEKERESVLQLAGHLNWPVFPDVLSGLRFSGHERHLIHYYDQLLISERLKTALKPDSILHIGGRFTSKRLLQYIESLKCKNYIQVSAAGERIDPSHRCTCFIHSDISFFTRVLIEKISRKNDDCLPVKLQNIAGKVSAAIDAYLDGITELTEPEVHRAISRQIDENYGFFMASSMPVRDMDMYASVQNSFLPVAANRGASGIDGTIASAAGFAEGLKKPVVLVTGDLAAMHDLNSLALLNNSSQPVTVIILNNSGGGIFSFLPIAKYDNVFERYFGTPHNFTFKNAAEMFGLKYENPASLSGFSEKLGLAMNNGQSTIIEITTGRKSNYDHHAALQNKLKQVIDALVPD